MTEAPTANIDQVDQGAALAFLDAKVRSGAAKRVDTHASIVFLESDRVLKVKRAVRLPFLDYSTLDKRKQACEEELAINRRFAPKLYRRVVPVTRKAGGIEIGGNGPTIEWAVEMARFDEGKTLNHLARSDLIKPELAEMLADVIRDSHEGAEISDGSTWLSSITIFIDRNTARFRGQASLAPDAVERLHDLSHRRLAELLPLLRERAEKGFVRRCHGDAHLGNIVLIDDKPVLFDAIEFDPVIATTDILYDLAFPIMDLVHFGMRVAANRLFNHYLECSWQENADALRLLPLFLSMRAAIRSHVLLTRCEQSPNDGESADAKSYFDLALQILKPVQASLIAIGGKSGTGKSALARGAAVLIGTPPGAVILRSDVIRKDLFGVDPLVSLPEVAYAPEVTERVYCTLNDRARQVIAQGFSVIVDAAFLREPERGELSADAARIGVDFRPLFLVADLGVRLNRVASRTRDASDATRKVAHGQEDYDLGEIDWPCVDASGSPDQTLERSMALLLPR